MAKIAMFSMLWLVTMTAHAQPKPRAVRCTASVDGLAIDFTGTFDARGIGVAPATVSVAGEVSSAKAQIPPRQIWRSDPDGALNIFTSKPGNQMAFTSDFYLMYLGKNHAKNNLSIDLRALKMKVGTLKKLEVKRFVTCTK
jgi:hypothetical protein